VSAPDLIHHVELRVEDLDASGAAWGWLLGQLGCEPFQHGWSQLYADRHPWAGGPDHYAAFLENGERFKVELVATRVA
jgi:hypothetical protein